MPSPDDGAVARRVEAMTRPRVFGGHTEQPLVKTLAQIVEASGAVPSGGSVLDVGCADGFFVQELLARGFDARGVDANEAAVAGSPVRERLWSGDLLAMPIDRRFDAVVASDGFDNLYDAEARILVQRIAAVSNVLIVVRSQVTPSAGRVHARTSRDWLTLFAEAGFGLEAGPTTRARREYLRHSNGPEDWHLGLLVLRWQRLTRLRRAVTTLCADANPLWRVIGAIRRRGRR